MRRYVVLIAYRPGDWDTAQGMGRTALRDQHAAFSAYVAERGRQVASAALDGTESATTVRHVDGATVVSDGPFAATAELIGGYYDVELPDLDAAIEAATLLPQSCSLEIRPVLAVT